MEDESTAARKLDPRTAVRIGVALFAVGMGLSFAPTYALLWWELDALIRATGVGLVGGGLGVRLQRWMSS